MSDFRQCDWKQFYGDVTQAIPPTRTRATMQECGSANACRLQIWGRVCCLKCNTSSTSWRLFPSQVPPTSMEITCQSSIQLSTLSLSWRRRATFYATMLFQICCNVGSLTGHIATDKNVADLLTKVLYGQKRRCLVSDVLHDIYDDFSCLEFFGTILQT